MGIPILPVGIPMIPIGIPTIPITRGGGCPQYWALSPRGKQTGSCVLSTPGYGVRALAVAQVLPLRRLRLQFSRPAKFLLHSNG